MATHKNWTDKAFIVDKFYVFIFCDCPARENILTMKIPLLTVHEHVDKHGNALLWKSTEGSSMSLLFASFGLPTCWLSNFLLLLCSVPWLVSLNSKPLLCMYFFLKSYLINGLFALLLPSFECSLLCVDC